MSVDVGGMNRMDARTPQPPQDDKLRVIFPPDPNPRPLKFTPPPGTCDTHFHVFGPPHVFPYAEARMYTPPAAPIEHWFSVAKALGIERGVLVSPTVHGFDYSAMHDALEKADGRLRGVIRANPELTAQDNKALNARGVRGVRFNFIRRLRGEFNADRFWHVVSRMEGLPWNVDLHTEPQIIEERAEIIRRVPLPVVIDHFGLIEAHLGLDQPAFKVLKQLLSEGNVWVKISSTDRQMKRGSTYQQVVAMARALIGHRPDRLIWGTDWPHSFVWEAGQMPNDGDLINMLPDFAPDEAIRKQILADNPARLFGFN
jgi:predicted TIM-barrel fold metal-dependent hydrolase